MQGHQRMSQRYLSNIKANWQYLAQRTHNSTPNDAGRVPDTTMATAQVQLKAIGPTGRQLANQEACLSFLGGIKKHASHVPPRLSCVCRFVAL